MMEDTITEMLVGKKGAIRLTGRVVVARQKETSDSAGNKLHRVIVGGILLNPIKDITGGNKHWELWEGEFIFIPHRVRTGFPHDGYSIEDMVVDLGQRDPEDWEELKYDRDKEVNPNG